MSIAVTAIQSVLFSEALGARSKEPACDSYDTDGVLAIVLTSIMRSGVVECIVIRKKHLANMEIHADFSQTIDPLDTVWSRCPQ